MTTQETTQATEATPTQTTPSIGDANLSFSDYERLRRGETLPAAEKVPAKTSAPDAKATEQNESADSDTVETEDEEGKDDAEGEDSKELDAKESEQEKPAKKKSGFQRRVDKLNQRAAAAQQEAEYWKREALKGATASKDQAKTDSVPAAAADGKPNPDKYETHADYVEAVADWKAEQKLKERDQKAEQSRLQAEQQDALKAHKQRVKAFAQKTDDFEEMVTNLDDVPLSAALEQIIMSSENGPELLYELAKDADEAKRIATLPPLAMAREIGKIESKLSAAAKASSEKKETKKLTQAPKPIDPVGGTKAAGAPKSPEEMSFSEYEKYRREQMRRKRG